ncbi:alpha/beta-hydrolase [Lentinus tigrinus ALCF2SS1-7]|uniref:Alpha/beta-hydrolase n=1 Tax=Lentinus tigrinus ALCF2SS1-6 TaxID=1328759 RepID=A0A5C2SN94_9APHY|nr:alpha/beta-hydrolase [Lentinus tigrinus ALCF2SS1-6]RPD82919.1 alpha/beta-hydrolase [Lentinus tigrinus ALCF2SS1-7]
MKAIRKLATRLRGGGASADVVCAAETRYVEGAISPVPPDSLSDAMKKWAEDAGTEGDVDVEPVDGVWWYPGHAELERSLEGARQGGGYVGLYFHGGGYVIGSARDVRSGGSRIPRGFVERDICACVLSVEYSLVGLREDPVRPFPLQVLEALSAYRHLVHDMKIPPKRVIVIGDSAGGHLVLALQRYLLESNHLAPPGGLVLLSPWVDLSTDRPQARRLLGALSVEHLSDPYFSSSLHSPPQGEWPPTLVYHGAAESFAPSIVALVARLTEAGALVTSYAAEDILEKFSHDFLIFQSVEMAWPGRVEETWTRIRAWVRALEAGD